MANRGTVISPYSKFRGQILVRLKDLGYIKGFEVNEEDRAISISLLYTDHEPAISDAKLYSKPGRRLYARSGASAGSKMALGVTLLSTSVGILTSKEAKQKKIGGELLFSVW